MRGKAPQPAPPRTVTNNFWQAIFPERGINRRRKKMSEKNEGLPLDPDSHEQIKLFEKFLSALEAGRAAIFTHTRT